MNYNTTQSFLNNSNVCTMLVKIVDQQMEKEKEKKKDARRKLKHMHALLFLWIQHQHPGKVLYCCLGLRTN